MFNRLTMFIKPPTHRKKSTPNLPRKNHHPQVALCVVVPEDRRIPCLANLCSLAFCRKTLGILEGSLSRKCRWIVGWGRVTKIGRWKWDIDDMWMPKKHTYIYIYTYMNIYIYTWNPNGAPCFEWSLCLLLEGFFTPKITSRGVVTVFFWSRDFATQKKSKRF